MSMQRKLQLVNGTLMTVVVIEYSDDDRRIQERALRDNSGRGAHNGRVVRKDIPDHDASARSGD